MTRIALAVLMSIGLSGFTAAGDTREARGSDGTRAAVLAAGSPGERRAVAVTAIKSVVNQSRWSLELRNTENPHKELNGADVPAIRTTPPTQRVDMWIPWAQTRAEFHTHHISVTLKDGDRVVRRYAIWQRSSFDGDKVRVGEVTRASDPIEAAYTEPGRGMIPVSNVGGNRTLTVTVNGDLQLAAAP